MKIIKIFLLCAVLSACATAEIVPKEKSLEQLALEEAGLRDMRAVSSARLYFDIRYATLNNFTNQIIYTSKACYLHKNTAAKLLAAYRELQSLQTPLTFIIYDCYRPPHAQEKLWEILPNPNYVSPPSRGSRHTRGAAVDLTLAYMDGTPLEMPTDFDTFTELAHMDNDNIPQPALANRNLLREVMKRAGFTYTRTEWWHYDDSDNPAYPLLDLPLP